MSGTGSDSDASDPVPDIADNQTTYFGELIDGVPVRYQTVTSVGKFRAFSVEELRLADYGRGKRPPTSAVLPAISGDKTERSDTKRLDLLRGNSIEIHVGKPISPAGDITTNESNTWNLPKKLISHYSPVLDAMCSSKFKEGLDCVIGLPEDDPAIFSLFVEWMYYDNYDTPTSILHSSTDAKCWVFGDKYLCDGFKNYAMSRLYASHVSPVFAKGVPCKDVQYALDNTGPSAKLRYFYLDFICQHFSNPFALLGTVEEWDALLQDHPDVRLLLLRKFREDSLLQAPVKDIKVYLDMDEPLGKPELRLGTKFGSLAITEGQESGESIE